MFKSIQINFTDPICDCECQDLSWGITIGPGLYLKCNTCETKVEVPNKKFRASINLYKKYPKYKCDDCNELHETGLTHDQATVKDIIK